MTLTEPKPDKELKLHTTLLDHIEQGAGRVVELSISYQPDPEAALEHHRNTFGHNQKSWEYYRLGVEVKEGISEAASHYIGPHVLSLLKRTCHHNLSFKYHLNCT